MNLTKHLEHKVPIIILTLSLFLMIEPKMFAQKLQQIQTPDSKNDSTKSVQPVRLRVLVLDKDNNTVNDVKQEEFQIWEDGKPQNITLFSQDEIPISYGLLIDNSASLRSQLKSVTDVSQRIIESNKVDDETFILRFVSSTSIERLTDLTSDKKILVNALSQLQIEGGQTAISDALYFSAKYIMQTKRKETRHYALIVITDGHDRASAIKSKELIEFLRGYDIQIFFVGLISELEASETFIRKNNKDVSIEYMDEIAEETGGFNFYPTKKKSIQDIAQNITNYIRRQYVLEYLSNNTDSKKPYRKIKVKLDGKVKREKIRIITRTGYKI